MHSRLRQLMKFNPKKTNEYFMTTIIWTDENNNMFSRVNHWLLIKPNSVSEMELKWLN